MLRRLRERNNGGIYFTDYVRSRRRDAALANMEWEEEQLAQSLGASFGLGPGLASLLQYLGTG